MYSVPKLAPCVPEKRPDPIIDGPIFMDDVAEPEPMMMAGAIRMA